MEVAEAIFSGFQIWLSIGGIVALFFLTVGIDRIDEDAQGAYAFRPLLVPACLLIWPLVLWRWYVLERGNDRWPLRHKPPREAHFWVAVTFAIAIPAIMLVGFSQKQEWPAEFQPQKLSSEGEQSQ